jgi:AsmA-like protein
MLAWIAGVFIVLLAVAYFVATSSAFFKGVILPKAGVALNAAITVSDASISPFKQVVLRDLKVQTTGTEPLLAAPEVRLRYSLMDIIRGNINVDEVSIVSSTVTLVENPDNTSNLDPILKGMQQKPAGPVQPSKPSKPVRLNVKKIVLNNAAIRRVKLYAGGKRDLAELSNVNVTVENVKNADTGKLNLGADIKVENNPPAPGTNGLLQAKLNGNFTFALTGDLKPASVQGNLKLDVTRAEAALAQAAGLGANLDCNITPTDVKQMVLRFQKGNTQLGELRAIGPFNMEKTEGRLSVELVNIDRNLLNMAGSGSGLDFGPTTINSTNLIELAKAGAMINLSGQFNLNKFQVTRASQTTPPLDLHSDYSINVDKPASSALVRTFTLAGTQKGNQVLRGELTSPMTVAWGNVTNAVGDSALNLTVNHLDLADWKAFAGDMAPAGDVNARLQLLSKQAGKQLSFDVSSEVANLTVVSGTNQITGAGVTLSVRGEAADLNQFKVPEYRLQLSKQNQLLVTLSGSATYEKPSETADAQLNGQLMLVRLLQAFPQTGAEVSSGTADLKAHITQKAKNQNITGTFTLADFTGRFGSNSFRNFGTTADLDLGMTPQQVEIRKVSGKVTEGQATGGSFDLSGAYDFTNKATQLNAKLANFNQNGLRAFLEPMLGDKKLVSVALNATAAVQYDPNGASSVKAGLQVTNLVVNDPKGQFPATPLEANLQTDASLNKQVADIRQCTLGLTPTTRATNQVQLTGRIDMSQTNATQGNIKLAADSLDFTSYYDLFARKSATTEKQPSTSSPQPTPTPAAAGLEKEPEPTKLPFRNFTADAVIGRFYLHEVQITNLQTTVKLDETHVTVNPCKLALNGAPVTMTTDLDLGVPGYKYDLSASARAIPLAPLVNTFQPENKGILSGTMTAEAKVTGAGTTGASLQKSLAGNFDIGSTNLNLAVENIPNKGVYSRLLKTLVNAIVLIPDLARNPSANLLTTASSLLSGRSSTGSGTTANDLSKSPIDSIVLRGSMGAGQILIQQGTIQSPAFRADASGKIMLDRVLTNSTIDIPVSVSLDRAVAQRINMVPPNTPTNAAYVQLPQFLAEKGTLGVPKMDINKLALAGAVLQGASGLAGKNSGLLQGLGAALTGGTSDANTGTNVNTNQPGKAGGLLQGLGGLLGGSSSTRGTNTPSATNAPATNQSPVGNLLNNLLGPRKK